MLVGIILFMGVFRAVVHNLFGQGPLFDFLNFSGATQVQWLTWMHVKTYEGDVNDKTQTKHKEL